MNHSQMNRPVVRPIAAGLVLMALVLVTAAPAAFADEVEDLIGGAGEAYGGGNLKLTLALSLGLLSPREDALVSLAAGGTQGYTFAPG